MSYRTSILDKNRHKDSPCAYFYMIGKTLSLYKVKVMNFLSKLFIRKIFIYPHIFPELFVIHIERRFLMSLELRDQYDKIYRYCYFKVKNKEIAEDLTQETFLKYFSQTSYISKGKPLAYLYTIAKNNCFDYFRKRKNIEIDAEMAAPDYIASFETCLTMKQAVEKLSEDQQELILLRFTNELGVGEIAKMMNLSRFVVYRRINSALTELKRYLREEDFHE